MAGIDSDLIRGHIDTIILKSLYRGDKYGLEILQEIEEKSGGTYEMKQPTLYSCLKRLETQGLISSYWEDSEIGGKRHYYTLTEKGRETYKTNQEEWMRSRAIIDNLIYSTQIDYAPEVDEETAQNNAKNAKNGQNNEEIDNFVAENDHPTTQNTESTDEEQDAQTDKIIEEQETQDGEPAEDEKEDLATETNEPIEDEPTEVEEISEDISAENEDNPSSEDDEPLESEAEDEIEQSDDDELPAEPAEEEPDQAEDDETEQNTAPLDDQNDEDDGGYALTNTNNYNDDYMSEANYDDDFATFDSANFTKPSNFFEANSEDSTLDEQDLNNADTDADGVINFNPDTPISSVDNSKNAEQNNDDLVTFDDTILLGGEEESNDDSNANSDNYALTDDQKSDAEIDEDDQNSAEEEPTTEGEPADDEDDGEDLNAIYNPEPEIPEDEQIYTPPVDEDDLDQTSEPAADADDAKNEEDNKPVSAPTYINFGNYANNSQADLTNNEQSNDEDDNSIFGADLNNLDADNTKNDADYDSAYASDDSDNDSANAAFKDYRINNDEPEQPSQPIVRASAEEINNMYRVTENYDNLQAGYTDETYKQMLNELEAYSSSAQTSKKTPTKPRALSLNDLTEEFESEGISVRRYARQQKENDDGKIYIKTNQIHMIKNWITFGVITFATLMVFLIMNAFRSSLTYNFALWQFVVAIACAMVVPIISTIKYLINPYKKVVAKYAPRLSILLGFLITIQLILIIYCVNLQLGFYSFAQDNYNHLLWIIPLILSFIPAVQSLIYLPLYQSKRYHI